MRLALTLLMVPRLAAAEPAPCVAIPQVTHDVYVTSGAIDDGGEYREGTTHWVLTSTPLVDVDGDGVRDVLVPQPTDKNQCPETMMWKVYLVRGRCGRELGTIGPGSVVDPKVPADASGFRPIVMASRTAVHGKRGGIPELTRATSSFAVVKGQYVRTGGTSETGVCHHCGVWTCHGA